MTSATETSVVPSAGQRWWRLPVAAITWRRTAYVILAPPLSALSIVAAVVGQGGSVAELQRRLLRGLLGVELEAAARWRGVRLFALGLVSAIPNIGALFVTLYGWSFLPMNLFYPLRAGPEPLDAWGGPTLEGAWAVHALGALPFAFVMPFVVWGITAVQSRLVRAFLTGGAGHSKVSSIDPWTGSKPIAR